MMKGSSEPWPKVLKELTDGQTDRLDPQPILDYFEPLYKWLERENLSANADWDCENYINKTGNSVFSYGKVLPKLSRSSANKAGDSVLTSGKVLTKSSSAQNFSETSGAQNSRELHLNHVVYLLYLFFCIDLMIII